MPCPRPILVLTAMLIFSTACSTVWSADSGELNRVQSLVDSGDYRAAKAAITKLLARTEDLALREQLAFETERMRRIEMEFTHDEAELLESLRRYIPAAGETDLRAWQEENLLEFKDIDGERRYFNKAAYNLMHISDAAAARSPDYRRFTDPAPLYRLHPHHRKVIAARAPLRNRFRVDYTLTVNADAVPAGETLRAWLPFPQQLPGRQERVALLASFPRQYQLAPESQAQRTIYFEQPARAGKATEFRVSYAFDSLARYTPIDPQRVQQPPADSELQPYLVERPPHIQFSEALRALSAQLVQGETNPYRIAQKLFGYVDTIPWAGAREYSTIRNISDYAARAGHADCGQQTLLLITLLRMNGIPARWQSGWEFSPGAFDTMHDWGEFYLAPYGWLPMDVTHGKLDGAGDAETWFYLGGLDAYRLIFNTDYSQPFLPAKQYFRSETVDSQRGEVEWRGGNLYFDQWDYQFDWQLVETSQQETARQ